MRGARQLRRDCALAVASLDFPDPFELPTFVADFAAKRGEDIQLVPVHAEPGAPYGATIQTDDTSYICYPANTTPLHAEHIVLHEIGHLVFEHVGQPRPVTADWAAWLPNVSPELAKRVLRRSEYTAERELAAEVFATIALHRVRRVRRIGTPARTAPRPEVAFPVAGLTAVFDSPPRPPADG
ncbi:hypothetical protein EV191_101902 [Tamaricihabitans halophyticus]|uniref:IrrE N-terminal-like domain-containing protein n=1 Tax=Tamaricihabitans halophyticus TaxID=1262583 RepID=A0A4R2R320_9PSEU|nr:hypothetical protein [Tamaricihabitans halophyticus]TCP56953.1 hypothetical protein EV191_101902 [Tamaricihabitans halophyticus]